MPLHAQLLQFFVSGLTIGAMVAIAPARNATPVILIIITLGVSGVLRGLALLIWGADPIPLPPLGTATPGKRV